MDWFLYDNGLRHERVKFKPAKEVLSHNRDGQLFDGIFSNVNLLCGLS